MGTLSNVPSDRSLRCIPRKHVRNCATPTRRDDIGAVSPHPPKTRKPVEVSISVDRLGGKGRAHEPSAAPRSRSHCSALVCKFVSPAFPASSSAISKSFRASSLRFNSTFAMPRLI